MAVEAMMHPVRGKLFVAIADRPGVSARQLSERIGEPIGRVRYHLRILIRDGLVAVKGHAARRGVSERFYHVLRDPLISGEEDRLLSDREKKMISLSIMRWIFDDAVAGISSATLEARPDRVLARVGRKVDRRGWRELVEIHGRALEDVIEIVDRSTDRLEDNPDEAIAFTSAILLFEAADW